MTEMEKKIMLRLCIKVMEYANLTEDKEADNLIQWVLTSNSLKENNNEIRKVTADLLTGKLEAPVPCTLFSLELVA